MERKSGDRVSTDYRWYLTSNITKTRAAALGFAATLLVLLVYLSPWGESLENDMGRKLMFHLRHELGRDPKLAPRLRIYALGDSTVEYLGADDLTLREWADLFESFVPLEPEAVFVDKIFSTPRGIEGAEKLVRTLSTLPYPVIAGVYSSEAPIAGRTPLTLSKAASQSEIGWLPIQKPYVYGPHPSIRAAFPRLGHLLYEGGYFVTAVLRPERNEVLPFAPLLVSGKVEVTRNGVVAGKEKLPIDRSARVLINWAHPSDYTARTFALTGPIARSRTKELPPDFPRHAVIVILPGMTTGNTDFETTPFGLEPGGYVGASIINSVLTGEWLSLTPYPWIYLVIAGTLGTAMALFFQSTAFLLALLFMVATLFTAGAVAFSYFSLDTPWLFSILSFSAAAGAVFTERTRMAERKTFRLREALQGTFSPAHLQRILLDPTRLKLQPEARELSLMFIDIANFSVAAEQRGPSEIFRDLRELIVEITDLIHAHGGVVDKTIGDGLLAFFGYLPEGAAASRVHHAEDAVRCALAIQRRIAAFVLAGQMAPFYPVRIGVNTDTVAIGDLGNSQRIDLALIGHGVNFAKRLEAACDSFRVMIGTNTYRSLGAETFSGEVLDKRYIRIKHHEELIEAYEIDPFLREPALRTRLEGLAEGLARGRGTDPRWEVPPGISITIEGTAGKGRLMNFSRHGMAVTFDPYIGREAYLVLRLCSEDGVLQRALLRDGLSMLLCEVKWGKNTGTGHTLGLEIKNLAPTQHELLEANLLAYVKAERELIQRYQREVYHEGKSSGA